MIWYHKLGKSTPTGVFLDYRRAARYRVIAATVRLNIDTFSIYICCDVTDIVITS